LETLGWAHDATLLPLQEDAEHYLKARKASDEQTFITECASAKTKIHGKLLVLAR
jgi:TfoX/Sxy family transcriptional regulator of competence genes